MIGCLDGARRRLSQGDPVQTHRALPLWDSVTCVVSPSFPIAFGVGPRGSPEHH